MADICSVSADTQNILNLPSKTRLTKKNNRKTKNKQTKTLLLRSTCKNVKLNTNTLDVQGKHPPPPRMEKNASKKNCVHVMGRVSDLKF